jgi:hypothetical protein
MEPGLRQIDETNSAIAALLGQEDTSSTARPLEATEIPVIEDMQMVSDYVVGLIGMMNPKVRMEQAGRIIEALIGEQEVEEEEP